VTLNAVNCIIKDNNRIDLWRSLLVQAIEIVNQGNPASSQMGYTDQAMVGCFVAVFFKKSLIYRMKQDSMAPCKVKVGMKGTAGNKGAVCIRF
jgi:hypothetical protein